MTLRLVLAIALLLVAPATAGATSRPAHLPARPIGGLARAAALTEAAAAARANHSYAYDVGRCHRTGPGERACTYRIYVLPDRSAWCASTLTLWRLTAIGPFQRALAIGYSWIVFDEREAPGRGCVS